MIHAVNERAAHSSRRKQASYERVATVLRGHRPGQQRGGVHKQRAADATVAAPADDPADAGFEAAVLEHPSVPPAPAEGRCPYQMLDLELSTYDFWELLQTDPDPVDARTVDSRNAR